MASQAENSESDNLGRRGESVDQVARQIREGILSGRYALGQRLITRELVTDLGYGRGTLREAFGQLAAEGLLELIPNRGATVRRLSRSEMRELFQIRESLEGLAARLAAEQIGEGRHRELMDAVWQQVQQDPPKSNRDFMAANQLLHETIVRIGGNAQLAQLLARIQLPLVMTQVNQSLGAQQMEQSHREHMEIVRAVLAGDPQAADQAMRQHLRRSGRWTLDLPDKVFKSA
jgi:DNA-binding GntR family transcriptional regulator